MISADPRTFEEFYESERDGLVRLGFLLTGSWPTAEELAQETLLAALRHWSEIDNPAAYARRAIVNLGRSHQRRWFRERRYEHQHTTRVVLPPDLDETWVAIQKLPSLQRVVLVLRFYEDMKVDDIADVLDKPAGSVKSLIHRSLAHLKEVLT